MAGKQAQERSGDGVYSYKTKAGTRYYFKYRKSDGRSATQRGFASVRAARRARERVVVSASMGERLSTTESFGEHFDEWLAARRPYLEPGTYSEYETHGRLRFCVLRPIRLTKLQTVDVERWLASLVAEDRYAPKTINNALVTLVVCLNAALSAARLSGTQPRGCSAFPIVTSSETTCDSTRSRDTSTRVARLIGRSPSC